MRRSVLIHKIMRRRGIVMPLLKEFMTSPPAKANVIKSAAKSNSTESAKEAAQ